MRRSQFSALTVSLVLAACGKSPSAPTSSGQGAPTGPTVTAVRVSGPDRVGLGETATYVATATYSDGSSKNVSADAPWSPTTPWSPIYFTRPGVAVGAHSGEIDVAAFVGGMRGSTHVLVLEKGTFKLSGNVAETSGRPLAGVSVDVVSGIGAGLHATSNSQGEYALYGVAGPIQLRASMAGFDAQVQELVVTSDSVAERLALAPTQPPSADISGTWLMTLTPSSACSAAPPDIARGRTYQLQIVQQGTGLKYTISGPTVTAYNQQFTSGVIFGSRVKLLFIGDTDYGDWSSGDITDQLSPTESMQFDGTVEGDLAGSEIRATMSGDITYYDRTKPTGFAPNWYCRAKDHGVVLRK